MTAVSQFISPPTTDHPTRSAVRSVAATIGCAYVAIVVSLVVVGSALVHLGVFSSAMRWDHHVAVWFVDHRTPRLDRVSGWFTWLANTMGIVVVAAVTTAWLALRRWGRWAWLLVLGLGLELASFLSANYLVRRPRPDVPHLGSTPSTFSWPSGHVAATFVLYGGIALLVTLATTRTWLRATAWSLAITLTSLVALSRVYRGEHHALDVAAGVALGVAALASVAFAIDRSDSEAVR